MLVSAIQIGANAESMLPMNPISVGNAAVPLTMKISTLVLSRIYSKAVAVSGRRSPEAKVGKLEQATQPVQTSSRGMCPTLAPLALSAHT